MLVYFFVTVAVSTRKDFNFYIMAGAEAFWTRVGIRPGTPCFLSWGCLFISDNFIFLLIYIIIMDNMDSTVPLNNKEAFNLEAAILNAIARFNVINLGLGIKKSLGWRSNPFENPDIRTQEIDRILSKISNMGNLGLYGVNPINMGETFSNAASAQMSSLGQSLQGAKSFFGFGGKKSRRRRRSGKRTRKHR
jgi:hypothetical protein